MLVLKVLYKYNLFCPNVFLPTGYSNTGKSAKIVLTKIRDLLGYSNRDPDPDHTNEKMLGIVMEITY